MKISLLGCQAQSTTHSMINKITHHDLVLAVREMLDRHLDVYEMASRLKVDITVIQSIIDLLT
jgi:hypothetical protein